MVFAPLPEVTVNLSKVRCEPPYTIITHSLRAQFLLKSPLPVNAHSSAKDSTLLSLRSEAISFTKGPVSLTDPHLLVA